MSLMALKKIDPFCPKAIEAINFVINQILKTQLAEKIYIFGSWLNGTFNVESDIDFAVIVPEKKDVKIFYNLLSLKGLEWPADVIAFDKKSFEEKKETGGIAMVIAEDGREVFPQTPPEWLILR